MTEDKVNQFFQALLNLDRFSAQDLVLKERKDMSSLELVEDVITPALEKIGEGWERGEIALSQVYLGGRICEDLVDILMPPNDSARKDQPRMAIAVLEDFHVLGKRIVYSTIRASGYSLYDYGVVDVEEACKRIIEDKIEIMFISTLMLPSALAVRKLRDKLAEKKIAVKLVVGGAPFRYDRQLWQEVGSDAMGYNATDVIGIIEGIITGIS